MAVNNIKLSAQTVPTNTTSETDEAARKTRAEELKNKLEAAQKDLQRWKSDSNVSEEYQMEIAKIETLLKAQSAAVEFYIENGEIRGSTGEAGSSNAASAVDEEFMRNLNANLSEGWSRDPYKGPDGRSTLVIPADSTNLAYKTGDDVTAITGETVGRDIIITITKKDKAGKETKETYVIKDGAVKRAPLSFVVTTGAKVDFSRVIRVDADGKRGNINILRLKAGETRCSQGKDLVIGSEEADIIWGSAGGINVYGGGGDDKIHTIGTDNYINGGSMDKEGNTVWVDRGQNTVNVENVKYNETSSVPDQKSIFNTLNGWTVSKTKEGYSVVKDPNAKDSEIDMKIPAGYSMAFAKFDESTKSLIVYLVGDDGKLLKVRFEGFFDISTKLTKFTIRGTSGKNMIDFGQISQEGNYVIKIDGDKDNDVIVGARNRINLRKDQLVQSTSISSKILSEIIKTSNYGNEDSPYEAKEVSGKIVISSKQNTKGQVPSDTNLYLNIPKDFLKQVYYYKEGDKLTLVFVKKDDITGARETLVVEIDTKATGLDISNNNIMIGFTNDSKVYDYTPTVPMEIPAPSELFGSKYLNSGGDGNDTYFGAEGSSENFDETNDIDWGNT